MAFRKIIRWKDYPVTIRPRKDGRWVIYWREANRGKSTTALNAKDAEEEALRIAKRVQAGQGGRLLTVEDAQIVERVKQLAGQRTAFAWLGEIEDAQKRLKGASLQQAVTHYVNAGFLDVQPISFDDAVEQYLATFKTKSKLSRARPKLELGGFNKAHPGARVIDLEHEQIKAWIGRKNKDGSVPGWEYYNSRIKAWSAFFNWCQHSQRKYWPAGEPHPAVHLEAMTPVRKAVPIWEPKTAHAILAILPADLQPYFIVGCWLGLRPFEIRRLTWEAFDWERGYLSVGVNVARKTMEERFVPLNDKAKALLAPWKEARGRVAPQDRPELGISKLARDAKLIAKWPLDVMRHSYISYQIAKGESKHQVAEWAGNSEGIIRRRYRRPLRKEDGEAWFAL